MSGLLTPTEFAGDDGRPDPRLRAALEAVALDPEPAARALAVERVVLALAGARLLVPVVAVLGDSEQSSLTGLRTDKNADMALVTLTAPDGRVVMPVFSGTDTLAAWDGRSRPVPVTTRRACLAAVEEGCQLLVVDPGSAAVVVPRPALWALAQAEAWLPSPRHPDVAAAVERAVDAEPAVTSARTEPGTTAELVVVLAVRSGLDRTAVRALTSRVTAALAASRAVADHVDSVALRLESV